MDSGALDEDEDVPVIRSGPRRSATAPVRARESEDTRPWRSPGLSRPRVIIEEPILPLVGGEPETNFIRDRGIMYAEEPEAIPYRAARPSVYYMAPRRDPRGYTEWSHHLNYDTEYSREADQYHRPRLLRRDSSRQQVPYGSGRRYRYSRDDPDKRNWSSRDETAVPVRERTRSPSSRRRSGSFDSEKRRRTRIPKRIYYGFGNNDDSESNSEDSGSDDSSLPFQLVGNSSSDLTPMLGSLKGGRHDGARTASSEKGQVQDRVPGINPHYIYESDYAGDGLLQGEQAVRLAEFEQSVEIRPRFKWIHFEDNAMHFDRFQKRVVETPNLTDEERHCLSRLFRRVPKSFDKPLEARNSTDAQAMGSDVGPIFLEEPLSIDKKPTGQDTVRNKSASLWCIPFFCLDQYSGNPSHSRPGFRPMRTLLQARFAATAEKRDKQQASCQVLDAKPPLCFHVAQMWCVVLDQSLLITCAQVPLDALRGDSISLNTSPGGPPSHPTISVSYGNFVLWKLPLEKCKTWFELISHFWEFWPNEFRLLFAKEVVRPAGWPKLFGIAKRSNSLPLTFQLGTKRSFKLRDVAKATLLTPSVSAESPDLEAEKSNDSILDSDKARHFHILTLLSSARNPTGSVSMGSRHTIDDNVKRNLELIDRYLGRNHSRLTNSAKDWIQYNECPAKDRSMVYVLLKEQDEIAEADQGPLRGIKKQINQQSLDILTLSESLFQLFLPLRFEGPSVSKFWGSVYRILEDNSFQSDQWDIDSESLDTLKFNLSETKRVLQEAARSAAILLDILCPIEQEDQMLLTLPQKLAKAWLHLLMLIVELSSNPDDQHFQHHLRSFCRAIEAGTREIAYNLPREELLKHTVALPADVALLTSLRVLKDMTRNQPDIIKIYSRYYEQLEDEVDADPSQRVYQQYLLLLKQEISIIRSTLRKQSSVFDKILSSITAGSTCDTTQGVNAQALYRGDYDRKYEPYMGDGARSRPKKQDISKKPEFIPSSRVYDSLTFFAFSEAGVPVVDKLSAASPGGLREVFAQDCTNLIDKRIRFFDDLTTAVDHLDHVNTTRFTVGQDRRELALYAFSIVTVIFLPLSTVAGIFGMNTNDIRNLDQDQWLFWAVAAPLSVVIIIGSLLWLGELGNVWSGFLGFLIPKRGRESRVQGAQRATALSRPVEENILDRKHAHTFTAREPRWRRTYTEHEMKDYGPPPIIIPGRERSRSRFREDYYR